MVLSGIAIQHADDGYSRPENFSALVVFNMVLICLPDGTNIYSSRGGV